MARRTFARSVVGVAACLVSITACAGGGASKATTTTSAAVAKLDFVNQANAICQTMNDDVGALPNAGSDPLKTAERLEQINSIMTRTLERLRTLRPPAGDEATLRSTFAKVDTLVTDYGKLAAALRAGDGKTVQQFEAVSSADQKSANDASNVYGLTVCGS